MQQLDDFFGKAIMVDSKLCSKIPVYEFIAHELKSRGIEKVFGLMSEDTAELVATLDSIGIRFYSARHENNAIGMAEGYSAASGSLGVAIIGRGPATANGLHAATYASRTGSKVLLITGEAPTASRPNGTGPDTKRFRSTELWTAAGLPCFRPHTSHSVESLLTEAYELAESGNLAVMMLPTNVQKQLIHSNEHTAQKTKTKEKPIHPTIRESGIEIACQEICKSKKPLIIAGKGAWASGAKESIEKLADKTGAILSTTLKAKDMFSSHPFHVGIVGSFSFGVGRRLIEEADCIIVLGAGLNQRTTSFGKALPSEATIIQVDSSRSSLGQWHDADVTITADIRDFVEKILQRLPAPPDEDFGFHTKHHREIISNFEKSSEYTSSATNRTMDPRDLGIQLNRALPENRRVAWDAGNFMGILPYIDVPTPSDLKNSSEFGSIGLGLSTAIGFAIGSPEQPTYLFVGDGGLLMSLSELETMAREDVPLVVFVINDCAYGAETHFLKQRDLPVAKSIFADIDFASVAEPFGIQAATVRTSADVESIFTLIRNPDGPTLIDCKINGQVAAGFTAEHPQ